MQGKGRNGTTRYLGGGYIGPHAKGEHLPRLCDGVGRQCRALHQPEALLLVRMGTHHPVAARGVEEELVRYTIMSTA